MRARLLLIVTSLAVRFTTPALTADLPGDVKTLDELKALGTKYVEACNQNDPAALAALFTEDAMLVTPEKLISGRPAIQRWYADEFQRWCATNYTLQWNKLTAVGHDAWAVVGEWWNTVQGPNGPSEVRGFYSAIYAFEGDAWKIRMSMYNVSGRIALPPPAGSPAGTP